MPTIFDQFVVLKPDMLMEQPDMGPEFYATLDSRYEGFTEHTLVSAHQFSENWGVWEIHPHGDELVILLSGKAELQLQTADGIHSTLLDTPGAFVVVPCNTWHTAMINEPTTMLFVTPGEDTQNAETPTSLPEQ